MKTKMILSIDWDYFYPDSSLYDWGANEENSTFFEIIWQFRTTDMNLLTRKSMLDEYHPTIPTNFWSIIKNKPNLYVADSHSDIWPFLNDSIVYNLDAHHDCGYSPTKNINCGNWAHHGLSQNKICQLHLFYPTWRKNSSELSPLSSPTSINYQLPKSLDYDTVFICRSSCWTPPWYDYTFQQFITSSGLNHHTPDNIWKCRQPDSISKASSLRDELSNLHHNLINSKKNKSNI